MNDQNQLCTSKSFDITNLRMLLPDHIIDMYINALIDYIHQSELFNNNSNLKPLNIKQNNRLVNQ